MFFLFLFYEATSLTTKAINSSATTNTLIHNKKNIYFGGIIEEDNKIRLYIKKREIKEKNKKLFVN